MLLIKIIFLFFMLCSCYCAEVSTIAEAKHNGFRFFVRHQGADGSWNPSTYAEKCTEDGVKCEPGQSNDNDNIALTADIIYLFLCGGYDHLTPNRYRLVMMKAVNWLSDQDKGQGVFGETVETQSKSTRALCKIYSMLGTQKMGELAQNAINHLLKQRLLDDGKKPLVWGDSKTGTINTALSLDALMALRVAQEGGLNIGDSYVRSKLWFKNAWKTANVNWGKMKNEDNNSAFFPSLFHLNGVFSGTDTSAGVCIALLSGCSADDIEMETLLNAIDLTFPNTDHSVPLDLRSFYLNSFAAFHIGNSRWAMRRESVLSILEKGPCKHPACYEGSWDFSKQLHTNKERGRLQSTVYAELTSTILFLYKRIGEK